MGIYFVTFKRRFTFYILGNIEGSMTHIVSKIASWTLGHLIDKDFS